jgi:methylphosphotriester-DNA--protein-cysteine methyltransferase
VLTTPSGHSPVWVFPIETGLTYKAWRQRARIVLAIEQLSKGSAVSQVAANAGFASTAASSFAFRQVITMTPTTFLDHPMSQPHRLHQTTGYCW